MSLMGNVIRDMGEIPDMNRDVVFFRYVDLLGNRSSFDSPEWRSCMGREDASFAKDRLKEAQKVYKDDCCIGWAYSEDLARIGKARIGKL